MHTTTTLMQDMARLGINPKTTLLVHSAYKSIGEVEGRADSVLDAWESYMQEGLLVLPTHTWATVDAEQPVFSVKDSPSCIGILPELFRKRPGVFRSGHPTHSVAARGLDAESFVRGDECKTTPCARDSAWGRLLDRNATVLFVGVGLSRDTFIHGVEEWLEIPGRLTETYEQLVSILADGRQVQVPSRRHIGHISEQYPKVTRYLLDHGVLRTGTFGSAQAILHETQPLYE
ncbi:MAG: AAC(3) family N-acetyltransferase, partial [Spirochaetae bacterium HGW-Spirochaetae-8]